MMSAVNRLTDQVKTDLWVQWDPHVIDRELIEFILIKQS